MTKPFQVSDLEADLLAQGLPAIQGLASIAAASVFKWLQDSLALEAQSNPLFAIGVPMLSALQPMVAAEIAKIAPPPVSASPASA